jgi:hypothetical protein
MSISNDIMNIENGGKDYARYSKFKMQQDFGYVRYA